MILETIAGSGLLVLLVERGLDYLFRRNQSTREFLAKISRATFSQVVEIVGDDRVAVHKLYRRLVDLGLREVGVKITPTVSGIVDQLFDQMWALREQAGRSTWNTSLAQLAKSGDRMSAKLEAYGKLLAREVSVRKPGT